MRFRHDISTTNKSKKKTKDTQDNPTINRIVATWIPILAEMSCASVTMSVPQTKTKRKQRAQDSPTRHRMVAAWIRIWLRCRTLPSRCQYHKQNQNKGHTGHPHETSHGCYMDSHLAEVSRASVTLSVPQTTTKRKQRAHRTAPRDIVWLLHGFALG